MDKYVEELLSDIDMGMIAIDHLVDKMESDGLRELVMHQRKDYGDLKERIHQSYPHVSDEVKSNFMLESMIELKTLVIDDQKIAKMLTEGSLQAVMKMTSLLNNVENIDTQIKKYADEFEDISKKYMGELKAFL